MSSGKVFGGFGTVLSFAIVAVFSQAALAGDPDCKVQSQLLKENNEQVVAWKADSSVPSGWRNRANVTGTVSGIIPDRNGHDHFIIQIGGTGDTIEIVYNQEFGALPDVTPGMQVHACGDFIKSTEQNGPYPPSPVGAIVHWVHQNPKHRGHEDGYLSLDGVVYGLGNEQNGHSHKHGR